MKIIAKLPNAGLANKLLVWAEAVVFANKANVQSNKIIVYPWVDFHPKRILRRDRDQRLYLNFFKSNDFIHRVKSLSISKAIENPLSNEKVKKGLAYRFSVTPLPIDYFKNLRGYENIVRHAFYDIIKEENINYVNTFPDFDVAIHVRRGDFPNELRISDGDVLEILQKLEKHFGKVLKVFLFSDGTKEELKHLLKNKNISFIQGNKAVVDIMLMSKAKVIVPSIRSTFSYFACFISNAHIVRHHKDDFGAIRDQGFPYYEGKKVDDIKLE